MSLGLEENYFQNKKITDKNFSIMRMNSYIPNKSAEKDK